MTTMMKFKKWFKCWNRMDINKKYIALLSLQTFLECWFIRLASTRWSINTLISFIEPGPWSFKTVGSTRGAYGRVISLWCPCHKLFLGGFHIDDRSYSCIDQSAYRYRYVMRTSTTWISGADCTSMETTNADANRPMLHIHIFFNRAYNSMLGF